MQVGDKMQANDPRLAGKIVEVVQVEAFGAPELDAEGGAVQAFCGVTRVAYRAGRRLAWVSRGLIFAPGEAHGNRGWTVVREN